MSDVKRQSILVVTRNFPPLTGGMERLMQNTVQCLSGQFDVTLIGPKGSRSVSAAAQTIECPSSPYLFLVVALLRGLLHCATRRYSFVVGGSGLVAPLVVIFAWLARASSATFVHGLDLVVRSRIYQTVFIPMIRQCETIIANSKNTRDIAVAKGCDRNRITIVNPGTDIREELSRAELSDSQYPEKNRDEQIVLFVGRFVKRKGLYPFIRRSWPSIAAKSPRARLVIIGEPPEKAIAEKPGDGEDAGQGNEPQLWPGVRFLGSVGDETLWHYYGLADVLVFPGIEVEGDVEGFGMVAIEAAACGTPTVAFSVGGVSDAVVDGENGCLVHPLDYDAFAKAVNNVLSTRLPSTESCRAHAQRFSWDKYGCRLNSVFER